MQILTAFLVTRARILTRTSSTGPLGPASTVSPTLAYPAPGHAGLDAVEASVSCLVPFIIGAEMLDR